MPFDGSTYTKPDVFSIGAVLDWLRTQDPAKTYDFMNCHGECLIGQYFASVDVKWCCANYTRMPEEVAQMACAAPQTFGGALARAEAALAQAEV